jgi:flavorubredoxin
MSAMPIDVLARPYQIAPDTFVIPWQQVAPPVGLFCLNSMVVLGREPMIVDTGVPVNRQGWLDAVFSLVEPEDVRWIFLSHEDVDHAGNLLPVLQACPNATLLTSWFAVGRMSAECDVPLPRCRFLNEGDSLDAGDRTFRVLRPPVYDSPTTRALFDSRTGVLWAVDGFASPVPFPVQWTDELPEQACTEGQRLGGRLLAPWHTLLDRARFHAHVDQIQSLPIQVMASAHAPAIRGQHIARSLAILRELPEAEPWAPFTQGDLESWLTAMAEPARPAG